MSSTPRFFSHSRMSQTRGSVPRAAVLAIVISSSLIASAAIAAPPRKGASPEAKVREAEKVLVRATQALMDAVARGDTAVWKRYLSEDCLYTDEEGNTLTRSELMASMHPLPRAYKGIIKMARPRLVIKGDVAVLTSDLDETLTLYGQRLETRFHSTGTWTLDPSGWKMIASQTSVLPSEHQAIEVDPASYEAYVGKYRLGPDVLYYVTRERNRIFGERKGGTKEELFPLGCDRFFRHGAKRGERVFLRDAKGRVVRMIDRRDNNDLVWRRVE